MKPEDQMRDALREVLAYCDELGVELGSVRVFAEQALNHTPDTNDHVGDANKMVRLSGDEISKIEQRVWANTIDKGGLMALFIQRFANALQDAMIKKNGG